MRDFAILLIHALATVLKLLGPGGARSVVAESLLVKQQILILTRDRQRAPNLRPADRIIAGTCALLLRPGRIARCSILVEAYIRYPSTHDGEFAMDMSPCRFPTNWCTMQPGRRLQHSEKCPAARARAWRRGP